MIIKLEVREDNLIIKYLNIEMEVPMMDFKSSEYTDSEIKNLVLTLLKTRDIEEIKEINL